VPVQLRQFSLADLPLRGERVVRRHDQNDRFAAPALPQKTGTAVPPFHDRDIQFSVVQFLRDYRIAIDHEVEQLGIMIAQKSLHIGLQDIDADIRARANAYIAGPHGRQGAFADAYEARRVGDEAKAAGVGSQPERERCTKTTPSCCSSLRICCDTVGSASCN
jgi:hypothetical protein